MYPASLKTDRGANIHLDPDESRQRLVLRIDQGAHSAQTSLTQHEVEALQKALTDQFPPPLKGHSTDAKHKHT